MKIFKKILGTVLISTPFVILYTIGGIGMGWGKLFIVFSLLAIILFTVVFANKFS
jgi:hypothetical protein